MPMYRVKVTETRTDHVWVTAETQGEALVRAPGAAHPEPDGDVSCVVVDTYWAVPKPAPTSPE